MKILVNTSNLVVGGALQVALSLIHEFAKNTKNIDYEVICSKQIAEQLEFKSFPKNFKFHVIDKSPAKLITRNTIIKKLKAIEKTEKPDIVFSVFGPSYWTPKAPHLMGFALGLITNPESILYQELSFKDRLSLKLLGKYKTHYVLKNASYYWCETEDVKLRMSKYLKINKSNIYVIGNTHSESYIGKFEKHMTLPDKEANEFRLVTISANYCHKNLSIIKPVALLLKNKGVNVKFFVTLTEADFKKLFPEHAYLGIINLGVLKAGDCPYVYEQCDALFLPTLLESFTASYPEAMVMKKPILTSDLSFAREICKNAAIYFNPLDPEDIANKTVELITNESIQSELITEGLKIIELFPSSKKRADMLMDILLCLVKEIKN